jgi:hypothetical protein
MSAGGKADIEIATKHDVEIIVYSFLDTECMHLS